MLTNALFIMHPAASSPPVFSIEKLTDASEPVAYFSPEKNVANSTLLNQPYRSTYYGIGLCTEGTALLMADLHDYTVQPGCLITISPAVIKQWKFRSNDYDSLTIFFRADFLLNHQTDHSLLDDFARPGQLTNYVLTLIEPQKQSVENRLIDIRASMTAETSFRNQKVQHLIWALLYETAEIHKNNLPVEQHSRKWFITNTFRSLVNQFVIRHRTVRYYANQLFVTPKHLTETVKETTGKTASDWINEALMLEARILLQNPQLTIAQVADQLSFPDQSVFGKFFKKQGGVSPLDYRRSLR